jgi:MFS family permease
MSAHSARSATAPVRHPGRTLTVLVAAQFVLMLDTSVTNMALPTIGRDLALSDATLSWVTNAYVVVFGGFLLLGGALVDGVGAARLFRGGLLLFGGASLLGGLAANGAWLVGGRLLQGLGAALLAPATLALLAQAFPAGRPRDRALAVWGVAGAAGAPTGAVVGGLLTGALGWSSVLLVNVPICAAAALAASRWPAGPRPDRAHPPGARPGADVAGAVTATTATTAGLVAITSVAGAGRSPILALGTSAAAAVALVGFVRSERVAVRPLLPLWLVRRRPIAVASGVAVLAQMAGYGMSFLLTLQLQRGFGLSPAQAGVAFLPFGAAAIASSRAAPWGIRRVGPGWSLAAGCASVAAGLVPMAAIPWSHGYGAFVLPALVLAGLGAGVIAVGVSAACIAAAPPERVGLAAAVVTAAQQLGGAVGLAAVSATASTVGGLTGVRAGYGLAAGFAATAAVVAAALVGRRVTPG